MIQCAADVSSAIRREKIGGGMVNIVLYKRESS
jgi:hypothetical protein